MLDELTARAQQAVVRATEAGASDAYASTSRTRSVSFTVRDGVLEKVEESTARSLFVRVYVEGRYTSQETTDLRPDSLDAFVAEAVALARALQPDPHRAIADPALYEGRAEVDLDLVDAAVRAQTREDRIARCQAMNAEVAGTDGVVSAESGASDRHSLRAVASSNGLSGTEEGTSLWMGTTVTVQDEGDKRPEGWLWVGGPHASMLPEPATVGRDALDWAQRRLGAAKAPSARTTMVVHPRAAGRLLSHLLRPARGRALQQGKSFWAGHEGKALFSDKLTLVDDPLLARGHRSRLFDGEGLAARPLTLIEAGVVKGFYLDTYYARKLDRPPTTGRGSNVVATPGERDLDAILAEVGSGFLVTGWLGGNSDGTTGDYSLGVSGHVIEGGAIGASMSEMNVTGSLTELFSGLAEVGNDPWPWSSSRVGTLVFEGVSFSGA